MADGPLNLTPDECAFLAVYAETCDRVRAVELTYPDVPPMERHSAATTVLSRPHVHAVVVQIRARALANLGLAVEDVLAGLLRVIDDPRAKPSDHVAAWRAVAKIAGLDAPRRVAVGFDAPPPATGLPQALVEQIQRRILGLPPAIDAEIIEP